jgi:two-component system chemotaxis response regulator CheB
MNPMILAIGASAGGIPPLLELLRTLPKGVDLAILVVLHRPVDFPSELPQIIRSQTGVAAAVAEEGCPLSSGRCYVSPPGSHLTITPERRIHLVPDGSHRKDNIDLLFRSLADNAASSTIGVVLSGMLRDGTKGLKALKTAGGTVMVQVPEEAQFPDMPFHAMTEDGPIDFVGPAKDLAREIVRLVTDQPVADGIAN